MSNDKKAPYMILSERALGMTGCRSYFVLVARKHWWTSGLKSLYHLGSNPKARIRMILTKIFSNINLYKLLNCLQCSTQSLSNPHKGSASVKPNIAEQSRSSICSPQNYICQSCGNLLVARKRDYHLVPKKVA